ncbi:hypothetical protein [Actinoplanes sp. CA-252034]|uniref:hypothetical protein n=1 Tax=Actinoplanes sp. CA-252034 TaxID=3239906 RepID=UPI003D99B0CF
MIGEDLKPKVEPPLPKRFAAIARVVQVITVFWSIYVFGVIAGFGGLSREWFYDKMIISPLTNFSIAMGATIVAMFILLTAQRRTIRWRPGKKFFSPLLVMAGMIIVSLVFAGGSVVVIYLEWLWLKWLVNQGTAGWLAALMVIAMIVLITVMVISELIIILIWAAVDCVQYWFGSAEVHPMLPPTAMVIYALAQTALYVGKAASGEYATADLTSLVYVVTFGAPVCLAVVAFVQFILLKQAGLRLADGGKHEASKP